MASDKNKPVEPTEWANAAKTIPNFDATRYERGANPRTWYADGSDAYAERGMVISFQHVPSKTVVSFKAFITAYNEVFSSDWGAETVYGRADPVYMFKNTTRKITLSFQVPAAAESEAFENLGRVQKLIQFLYPNYTTVNGGAPAQTISQSPLVRLKLLNLAQKHFQAWQGEGFAAPSFPYSVERKNLAAMHRKADQEAPSRSFPSFTYDQMIKAKKPSGKTGPPGGVTTQTADSGLLGVIQSLDVNYNLEEAGGFEEGAGVILPKLIDVNITFGAIHEHVVGWTKPTPVTSAKVEPVAQEKKVLQIPEEAPEEEEVDPTAQEASNAAAASNAIHNVRPFGQVADQHMVYEGSLPMYEFEQSGVTPMDEEEFERRATSNISVGEDDSWDPATDPLGLALGRGSLQ